MDVLFGLVLVVADQRALLAVVVVYEEFLLLVVLDFIGVGQDFVLGLVFFVFVGLLHDVLAVVVGLQGSAVQLVDDLVLEGYQVVGKG